MKVRSLADLNEEARIAWQTGARGAVLDALRLCNQYTAPLPAWLAQAVEEALTWWSRDAPTGKRGRQARYGTERREAVRDLEREEFYQSARRRGLAHEGAQALAAGFFEVAEETIRDSLRRAKRMPPATRYLGLNDRRQMYEWLRQPNAKERLRRWEQLERALRAGDDSPPPKP